MSSDFCRATISQNGLTVNDVKNESTLFVNDYMYTNPLIGREQSVAMLTCEIRRMYDQELFSRNFLLSPMRLDWQVSI